ARQPPRGGRHLPPRTPLAGGSQPPGKAVVCPAPHPTALQGSPANFSGCPAMITLLPCVSVSGCASC
ncbi:TPA: hypothetical protein ACGBKQ_005205, partial [Escherichia coli]